MRVFFTLKGQTMYENRVAFRTMLGLSEGTVNHPLTKNNGYDVIVTGIKPGITLEVFTDYRFHPFAIGNAANLWREPKVINAAGLQSTASGRYQILRRYWLTYAKHLSLRSFGPAEQDLYVDQQFRERGALELIDLGKFEAAVTAISGLWASMPGKAYDGQRQHSLDRVRGFYLAAGGKINN